MDLAVLCKCRTQGVAGLQGPGGALRAHIFIHSINSPHLFLHCILRDRQEKGRGSSQLCSVGSQQQDKTFACKLPVHSLLPHGPPGLQQFPERIPSRMQSQAALQHWHWRPRTSPAKGKASSIWGWQESVLPPPPCISRIHPLQPQICASSNCSHSGQSEVRKPVPQHLPVLQAACPAPGHKPCSRASPAFSHSALEKKGLEIV